MSYGLLCRYVVHLFGLTITATRDSLSTMADAMMVLLRRSSVSIYNMIGSTISSNHVQRHAS